MTHSVPARLRLGFAGTPPFAASILSSLVVRHDVVVVYSQPPRRTGRGRQFAPSAAHQFAITHNIESNTPDSLRGAAATLATYRLDVLVVVAYGLILPGSVLSTPAQGCINVHASLLPRWRGAAPIERAMLAGDSVTGITVMQMEAGLDTGPILHQVQCPIHNTDTGDSLRDRLADMGAVALLQCLDQLNTLVARSQTAEGVTYAHKLTPVESHIDWAGSARDIALKIRGLNSRQPAFCTVADQRLRLLFADPVPGAEGEHPGAVVAIDRNGIIVACASGRVRITRVALSRGTGKPMDIASLINGYPDMISVGLTLG